MSFSTAAMPGRVGQGFAWNSFSDRAISEFQTIGPVESQIAPDYVDDNLLFAGFRTNTTPSITVLARFSTIR